jgi:tRNA(fMet)-specific endonuclease VapC
MFVLDSDTYTHYLLDHPKVTQKMTEAEERRDVVTITIITKIELLQGRMSALLKADTQERFLKAQQRFEATEEALYAIQVLPLDESALDHFFALSNIRGLKKIGRADLLIAGITLAHPATLVTRNQQDFQKVPQLKLENWVD